MTGEWKPKPIETTSGTMYEVWDDDGLVVGLGTCDALAARVVCDRHNAALKRAVAEEREACARIADALYARAARKTGEEPASLMDEALRLEAMARPVKIGEEQG